MFRRAERPEGEPVSLDEQVRRAVPVLEPGMASVYTMPREEPGGPKKRAQYVGTYDTWLYRDQLNDWQQRGYLIWSVGSVDPVYA